MKKIMVLLLSFTLLFTLAACSKEYTNIDNEELKTMLETPGDYQFVDVRTKEEYDTSHVPGFNIQVDYYIFKNDYSLLSGLDKDIPVIIMCNSGNRSVSAAKIFLDEGFEVVYNLTDGIQGWDGPTE
jgi:phage shock protein E